MSTNNEILSVQSLRWMDVFFYTIFGETDTLFGNRSARERDLNLVEI